MLTRFHKVLLALLAVQIILVVVVVMTRGDGGALKEHPLVAGFDAAKVTRLQVWGSATGKPVDLVKRDAKWVLASGFDYPVGDTKVTDALAPIAKLSAAAPIASAAARYKQLHVADDDFERKLVITAGGKDLTMYLGSGAGARRTAVRIAGDDGVYGATGITTSQVSGDAKQWIDPTYVKIPTDEIAQVTVARDGKTIEFARVSAPAAPAAGSGSDAGSAAAPTEHWTATVGGAPIPLAAGETIDEPSIDHWVGQVATIDLSAPGDPKRDASRPIATITIERKAKDAKTSTPTIIDVVAEGESYWVHDRSQAQAAIVDHGRLDDVLGAERGKVIRKPLPPPPAPSAIAPGAGSGSAARPGTGSAARPS
jgi:antitoxin (DNA-binding transcriptional repressor) of toxin-antitoxin stability system